MSGWCLIDSPNNSTYNSVLYAHGKSGSTSLAHLVDTGVGEYVITDYEHDCASINAYIDASPSDVIVFLRDPYSRFISGMWQCVSETLRVALPMNDQQLLDDLLDEPLYWRAVTERMFHVLGFSGGNPQLSDISAYHLAHYLEMFEHLRGPFVCKRTGEMTSVLTGLGIQNVVTHNQSIDKPLGEYYTMFSNAIQDTPSWPTVVEWLQPEVARYTQLMMDNG